MDKIFHEKQEGSLCAQHCLNALLQGNYFTAVELAELAQQLDETERQRMAEGGMGSEEYRNFLQQPSSNFDDSGYFSIQVLQTALRVWGLELVPFQSSDPVAQQARADPTCQNAYICNFKDHWFCIRKIGLQWFNLNSLLTGPELVSNTFLSLLLTQLQQEGYAIFVVVGELMTTEADQLLSITPAVQPVKPRLITDSSSRRSNRQTTTDTSTASGMAGSFSEDDLAKALEESRRLVDQDDESLQRVLALSKSEQPDDEASLQQALALSLQGYAEAGPSTSTGSSAAATSPSSQEVRDRRQAFLDRLENKPTAHMDTGEATGTDGMTEEEMLQAAIAMSMSGESS